VTSLKFVLQKRLQKYTTYFFGTNSVMPAGSTADPRVVTIGSASVNAAFRMHALKDLATPLLASR
jgi:hypothetical protein